MDPPGRGDNGRVRIHAITVLGHDRPGIIADVTGRLAGLGLNLEDTTMTRLRGHFAMTLICSGEVDDDAIRAALAPLGSDDTLAVAVYALPADDVPEGSGRRAYVLSVHGGDRPGIVSSVTARIAAVGGNVTDLTTRLVGRGGQDSDLYVVVADLTLPDDVDVAELQASLAQVAREVGVEATLRPADADDL